jgi:hypothetical protein
MKIGFIYFFMATAFGYSSKIHSYLGNLTEDAISLETLNNFEGIALNKVSIWADKIKNKKGNTKYNWLKNLHYIDINKCNINVTEDIIKKYCPKNNCIYNTLNYLMDNNFANLSKWENWALTLHLLQDLFQPMHTCGFYRGGNTKKIKLELSNGKFRKINIHQLFDLYLPKMYMEKIYFKEEQEQRKSISLKLMKLRLVQNNLDFCCKYINWEQNNYNLQNYFELINGSNFYNKLFSDYIYFSKMFLENKN